MSTLITAIKSIITSLESDATIQLSSHFMANIDSFSLDTDELPFCIINNEISKNATIQQNANITKATKILISFLKLDSDLNTDEQTNTIVEEMELLADRVAAQIFRLSYVRPGPTQDYELTPVFHAYNTNLSGTILKMDIVTQEVITCTPPS